MIKMGKNVTIYLPDDIAKRMEDFPEVNWSEVCRRAVVNYIEARSNPNISAIIERFKKEKEQEYKQGQQFAYELATKLPYVELAKIVEDYEDLKADSKAAQEIGEDDYASLYLSNYWKRLVEKYSEQKVTENYAKGFRDALIEIYRKV